LTTADVAVLQQYVPDIAAITPILGGQAQVAAGANNWNTRVQGHYPDYQTIGNYPVSTGAFFTQADEASAAPVAVLGQTVVQNLFPNGVNPVGQQVRIRTVMFQVVGVLTPKGNNGFQDQDDIILIPYSAAQGRLFGGTTVNQIQIQVNATANINPVIADATQVLALIPPAACEPGKRLHHSQQPAIRHGAGAIDPDADPAPHGGGCGVAAGGRHRHH